MEREVFKRMELETVEEVFICVREGWTQWDKDGVEQLCVCAGMMVAGGLG